MDTLYGNRPHVSTEKDLVEETIPRAQKKLMTQNVMVDNVSKG